MSSSRMTLAVLAAAVLCLSGFAQAEVLIRARGDGDETCCIPVESPLPTLLTAVGMSPSMGQAIVKSRPFLSQADMEKKITSQEDGASHWESLKSMIDVEILCPPQAPPQAVTQTTTTTTTTAEAIKADQDLEKDAGAKMDGIRVTVIGLPDGWGLEDFGFLHWQISTLSLSLEIMSKDPMAKVTSKTFIFSLSDLVVRDGAIMWVSTSLASLVLQGRFSDDRTSLEKLKVVYTRTSEGTTDVAIVAWALNGLRIDVNGLPKDWSVANYGYLHWDKASERLSLTVPTTLTASTAKASFFYFKAQELTLESSSFSWPSQKYPNLVISGKLSEDRKQATDVAANFARPGGDDGGDDDDSTETTSVGWLLQNMRIQVNGLPKDWETVNVGFTSWDATAGMLTLVVPSKNAAAGVMARKFFFYTNDMSLQDTVLKWRCRQYTSLVIMGKVVLSQKLTDGVVAFMERSDVQQVTIVGVLLNGIRVPVSGLPASWRAESFGLLAWEATSSALTLTVPTRKRTGRVIAQKFFFYGGEFRLTNRQLQWACRHFPSMVLTGKLARDGRTIKNLLASMQRQPSTALAPQQPVKAGELIAGHRLKVTGLDGKSVPQVGELSWDSTKGTLIFKIVVRVVRGRRYIQKYEFAPEGLATTATSFIWMCKSHPSLTLHGKFSFDRKTVFNLYFLVKRQTLVVTHTITYTTITWLVNKLRVPVSGLPPAWGALGYGLITIPSGIGGRCSCTPGGLVMSVPVRSAFGRVSSKRFYFVPGDFKAKDDGSFVWICGKFPSLKLQGALSADRKRMVSLRATMERSTTGVVQVSMVGLNLNGLKVPVTGLPVEWGTAGYGFLTWDAIGGVLNLGVPTTSRMRRVIAQKFIFNKGDFKFDGKTFSWKSQLYPAMVLHGRLSSDQQTWKDIRAENKRPHHYVAAPKYTDVAWKFNGLRIPVVGIPSKYGLADSGQLVWHSGANAMTLIVHKRYPYSHLTHKFVFYGSDFRVKGLKMYWMCKAVNLFILRGQFTADMKNVVGLKAVQKTSSKVRGRPTPQIRPAPVTPTRPTIYVRPGQQRPPAPSPQVVRVQPRPLPAPLPAPPPQAAACKTTTAYTGHCLASFTYRGTRYTGQCTKENHHSYWCYTVLGNGRWGNCVCEGKCCQVTVPTTQARPINHNRRQVHGISKVQVASKLHGMRIPVKNLPRAWNVENKGSLTWSYKGELTLLVSSRLTGSFQQFKFYLADLVTPNSEAPFRWTCKMYPRMTIRGQLYKGNPTKVYGSMKR